MQKYRISLVLLLAIFSLQHPFPAFGEQKQCSRATTQTRPQVQWPNAPLRPFDVLKYHVVLDWRRIFETKSQKFSGVNTLYLKTTGTTTNITLDAGLLAIDSIKVNGVILSTTPQPDLNEELVIPLPLTLQTAGSQITIEIAYRKETLVNKGLYFFPKGAEDPNYHVFLPEDLAYTMSEPTDAHYWMPCKDQPNDKAESEISIIVPSGIETASNGALLNKVLLGDGSIMWNWKSDKPISTYLMVADASNFVHWGETHSRSAVPGDTVHLEYYAWPDDYNQDSIVDGTTYNAKNAYRNTSGIMTAYEAKYGPFPFEKYGQVPVQPFTYGGMEHQSITTIHREWLRGRSESGIAHEMAHQWFGDKTTCESFKDIWLNEGFATYSEAIFGESWGGIREYNNHIYSNAYWCLSDSVTSSIPTYDPPSDLFNYTRTYCKGACVLHMLRRMVDNDTSFFGALRDYSNAFAYTSANTVQFRDFMSGRLGIDLTEFMDQWIFGALNPTYDVKWAQDNNNKFFVRINQTQSVRDHFTMPVKLFAYHNGILDTLKFQNDIRSQAFQKTLGYKIDSLHFDSDAIILSTSRISYAPELSVCLAKAKNGDLSVYPEGSEIICKFSASIGSSTIELYNSVGIRISTGSLTPGQIEKRWSMRDLASGIYFVRVLGSDQSQIRSVNIIK
ncbi:MAG: M1 family aminopeptidase [Ignavibacteriota bacterium]